MSIFFSVGSVKFAKDCDPLRNKTAHHNTDFLSSFLREMEGNQSIHLFISIKFGNDHLLTPVSNFLAVASVPKC